MKNELGEKTRLSYLKAKTVHLEEHFAGKEHNEEEIGDTLEVVQPRGLTVVFSSKYTGV